MMHDEGPWDDASTIAFLKGTVLELEEDYEKLKATLKSLLSNPHINLGDLVYQVRDAEGLGWDGPSVKAWSDAVAEAKKAVGECGMPCSRACAETGECDNSCAPGGMQS